MMQHEHLSVQNATRAAVIWAASPVGRLVRVEVLVTLSCTLLSMLVFLGSARRYSRSSSFRVVVWSALMLSYPAVSYTIGLMQSADSFRNDLMVVWACFLLGCADGIAACSVDDSDQQARLLLNQAAQAIYVFLLLLSYASSLRLELKILLFLFWVLIIAKLVLRLHRLLSAGRDRTLTVDNALITKYMKDVSQTNHCKDKSYKFLVAGEENLQDDRGEYKRVDDANDDIVTVDDAELDNAVRLYLPTGSSYPSELLNLCISFALFKLLRRRLTGSPQYELHDGAIRKVRRFFYERIGERSGWGQDMLGVIEVELGFLFDFFYSRYPSHKQSLIPETIVFAMAAALSMSSLFSSTLRHYGAINVDSSIVIATTFDIWLARLVIFLFLVLEVIQYLSLVLSNWHRVKRFCRLILQNRRDRSRVMGENQMIYMLTKSGFRLLKLRATDILWTRRYWSNTVGQYSLLHAAVQLKTNSCISCIWLMPSCTTSFLIRTSFTTHRSLPDSVKVAIAHELKNSLRGILDQQETVLYYDPKHVTLGAAGTGSIIRIPKPTIRNIMILHIATTLSAIKTKPLLLESEDKVSVDTIGTQVTIAATLSAYCGYLICDAPELITDNIYEAQLMLEGVQRRVLRQCLKYCRSEDDLYTQLMASSSSLEPAELEEEDEYEAIVAQGARLSEVLTRKLPDEAERWGLLAQLWVKFLLSNVAPSNNVSAHVKRLASGGEFITHLWAFMTQGGFVKQPWISCGDGRSEDTQQDLEAQDREKPDNDVWMEMLQTLG